MEYMRHEKRQGENEYKTTNKDKNPSADIYYVVVLLKNIIRRRRRRRRLSLSHSLARYRAREKTIDGRGTLARNEAGRHVWATNPGRLPDTQVLFIIQ